MFVDLFTLAENPFKSFILVRMRKDKSVDEKVESLRKEANSN